MIAITDGIRNCLHITPASLWDPSHRWAQPIGFTILRDPHFTSVGDASGRAEGAHYEFLRGRFDNNLE
jgi:hypothetical protein